VKVIVEFPAVADDDAVNVKLGPAPPAEICALEGETVIPEGKPDGCTETALANPLLAVTLTFTDPDVAKGSVSEDAESARLKSGVGELPPPPLLGTEDPPQPARKQASTSAAGRARYFRARSANKNSAEERDESK
jgi:hypothetical protein